MHTDTRAALCAGAVPLQWVREAVRPLRRKCQAAADTQEKESSTTLASPQVRIETQHSVAFGQVIKVVGSVEALGNWEATAAPGKPTFACLGHKRVALDLFVFPWRNTDCRVTPALVSRYCVSRSQVVVGRFSFGEHTCPRT